MFSCNRCGASIDALALFHAENRDSDNIVYCIHCSKIREREGLRKWASEWADATLRDDMVDDFFIMLEAVWTQGFIKARTFEDGEPISSLRENPFSVNKGLFDPLEKGGGLHGDFSKVTEDSNSVEFFFSDEDKA